VPLIWLVFVKPPQVLLAELVFVPILFDWFRMRGRLRERQAAYICPS
jgi:hypothetical protein